MRAVALSSRFLPPRTVHEMLDRPVFCEHLRTHFGVITVLVGPPGSGRTSILSSCYQSLINDQQPACWLNLSSADNDVQMLRANLLKAFFTESQIATGVLGDFPAALTGFIDGVQWLDNPQALELLQSFVLSVPANSRLMLSAAQLKGRLLSSAQLSGLVAIFGPKQLHFNDEQAAYVLGDSYSAQQVRVLNQWVDGWPAGLRFLACDPRAAATLIHSPEQAILPDGLADYIEMRVTQALTEQQLSALMELSVLERFIPELIACLHESSCDWGEVEALLQSGWMLRYLDLKQDWVGVNPALACHFAQRLRKFQPARYQALKTFAAHWLNEHGYCVEAARHAVSLGQPIMAAQLIEAAGAVSLDLGAGPKIVLNQLLTAEQAAQFPLVFIGQLYMRIRAGKLAEAYTLFRQAWQLTRGFREIDPNANSDEVRHWALLYEQVFLAMLDRPASEQDLQKMRSYLEQWLIKEPVLAASWASILGYRLFDNDCYQAAIGVCENGVKLSQLDHQARIASFLWIHKATAALALGQLDTAWQGVSHAEQMVADDPETVCYERVCANLLKGVLLFHQGQSQASLRLLQSTLSQIADTSGWAVLYADAYAVAIECACLAQDFTCAMTLLTDAQRFAQSRNLARLKARLLISRVQLHLRAQNWREAMQLIDSECFQRLLLVAPSTPYQTSLYLPASLVAAQTMLALGRPAHALNYLEPATTLISQAHCRLQISYGLLKARAHFAVRRYSIALNETCQVYQQVKESQIQQVIGLEYESLGEIISWAKEREKALPEGVLAWLKPHYSLPTTTGKGLQLLSPRESEVMILVTEGLTNKEIAQRLDISEGTVKGHRKRIHEKLGVNSRSQAITKARELLLI